MDASLFKTLMVFVLIALGLAVLRWLIRLANEVVESETADAEPAKVSGESANYGIPQEHVAAIAAALSAMLGAHRIIHIEPLRGARGWSEECRLDHHRSHTVERRALPAIRK